MAQYDIRTLQMHLLSDFKTIDKILRSHGLRYFMVSGTMLGAVRHKGFIPWDDDIDIAMPRADYEKLLKHAGEWLPNHLELVCPEEDPDYPLPYAKIQNALTTVLEKTYRGSAGGTFIDIFPLDGVPSGKIARWWHFRRFLAVRKLIYFIYRDPYKHGHGPRSWIPLMWQKLFPRKWTQAKLRQILMENDYDNSEFVSEHYNASKLFMKRSVFGQPKEWDFEGEMLLGVENGEEYLTIEYGRWQEIPPVEKRAQHNFHYLNLQQPYREYIKENEGKQA